MLKGIYVKLLNLYFYGTVCYLVVFVVRAGSIVLCLVKLTLSGIF